MVSECLGSCSDSVSELWIRSRPSNSQLQDKCWSRDHRAAPHQSVLTRTQRLCPVSNVPNGHSGHCQDLYTPSITASGKLHELLPSPGIWICQLTPEMKVCKDLYWIYPWLDCQEAILPSLLLEDCPSTSSGQHTCIHSQQKILALPLTTAQRETRSAAVQHSGCK